MDTVLNSGFNETEEIRTTIENEINDNRAQVGFLMRKIFMLICGSVPVLLFILWLTSQQHTQFVIMAIAMLFPLAIWAIYPLYYRQGKAQDGLLFAFLSMLLVISIIPLIINELMPIIAMTYCLMSILASLLLGGRASLWIGALCVIGFTGDLILIRSLANQLFPALPTNAEMIMNIAFGLIAGSLTVFTSRTIMLSQEAEFRQARIAFREIERQALVEAEQREALERNQIKIERQTEVERKQREYLEQLLNQVRIVIDVLKNAVVEIQAAAAQQLSSATEQDAAVTQTVATVEEVRTTVNQTSERAQAVAEASQQTVSVSHMGQNAVKDTIEGMRMIQQRVNDIAQTILMLSERTQQIGQIIEVVNALADQSKLLALNASIEAARVGEEGKGFAVVAMEVRQLATESREATARVESILSEIQQATNTAVMVTEQGSKETEKGVALVERAGDTIRDLTAALEVAAQAATQIAASTHQQTNGMDQLAAAMAQFQQVSAQTTASTKQTEDSIRNILETTQQLEEVALTPSEPDSV